MYMAISVLHTATFAKIFPLTISAEKPAVLYLLFSCRGAVPIPSLRAPLGRPGEDTEVVQRPAVALTHQQSL